MINKLLAVNTVLMLLNTQSHLLYLLTFSILVNRSCCLVVTFLLLDTENKYLTHITFRWGKWSSLLGFAPIKDCLSAVCFYFDKERAGVITGFCVVYH